MEEDKDKSLSGFIKKIKKVKHIEIIIALVAVAIMLLIYFSSLSNGKNTASNNISTGNSSSTTRTIQGFYSDYCEKMQSEITNLVSGIKGAGNSTVVISWESSVELIIAYTQNNNSSSSSSSPVIINNSGSSAPIVLKEIYPKALGVLVICDGGADARAKVGITFGISTLLGISTDKIVILEANNK